MTPEADIMFRVPCVGRGGFADFAMSRASPAYAGHAGLWSARKLEPARSDTRMPTKLSILIQTPRFAHPA